MSSRERLRIPLVVISCAALVLWGCASIPLTPDDYRFMQAERAFNNDDITRALLTYQSLDGVESQRFREDTILFRMGECYRRLDSPADARMAFVRLKEQFPQSDYIIDVNNRLEDLENRGDRMVALQTARKDQADKRLREARRELSAMEAEGIEDDAKSAYWFIQAAEALWDLERYEDARDAYVAAINLEPELRYDPKIQGRLIFPPETEKTTVLSWLTGRQETQRPLDPATVIPMTPQGELRWPGGKQPLVIYNTTLRYLRVEQDPRARYAIVTGQVVNQSNIPVSNASVEVTLTSMRDEILGVSTSPRLPRLEPRGTAAFRVELGPFDDFENIASYSARVLLSPEEVGQ